MGLFLYRSSLHPLAWSPKSQGS